MLVPFLFPETQWPAIPSPYAAGVLGVLFQLEQTLIVTPFPDPRGMLGFSESDILMMRVGAHWQKAFSEEQIAFALRQRDGRRGDHPQAAD